MSEEIIREKQDLTHLKWSHIRTSSGTAGTFLKSSAEVNGEKIYYRSGVFREKLAVSHREQLFSGLQDALSEVFRNRIWEMIYTRYQYYEAL